MPNENHYANVPQNDISQINLVRNEYSSEPAKGIVHGLQKDAIQNCFGARADKDEVRASKNWATLFELTKINGKYALVFWDEGTTGLTGDIIKTEQILEVHHKNALGPEQRLSRFLSRFISGDNIGAGLFGRGKLVFHAAAMDNHILIDSVRSDDDKYIALERKIIGMELKQSSIPFQDDDAKKFIIERSGGILQPLEKYGTRITILNVLPEIADAFKKSFESNHDYRDSFAYMIEETWWEILNKFDSKITLKYKGKEMSVRLRDELKQIAEADTDSEHINTYVRRNIDIVVQGERYRIKELKLMLFREPLSDGSLQDIWLQRRRMKVCSLLNSSLRPNSKIAKRLCGFVILEEKLEHVVETSESTTHYSCNFRNAAPKKIREIVREHLGHFEKELGLVSSSASAESRQRLLDSMKEINELAEELGLVTQQAYGADKSRVDILLDEIKLPEEGTLRVELGDKVGPMYYTLRNNVSSDIAGCFTVHAFQRGLEKTPCFEESICLKGEDTQGVEVLPFELKRDIFETGKPLFIEAVFVPDGEGSRKPAICRRTLYVGMEQPPATKKAVSLAVNCKFPHKDTRRVERTEFVRNIKIRMTNNSPHNLSVDLAASVRHFENPKTGRTTIPLFEMMQSLKNITLKPQQDFEIYVEDIEISESNFGSVLETVADVSERCCDMFCLVRLTKPSLEMNLPRKYKLNKVSIKFYVEVDPPGNSIFQDVLEIDEPSMSCQSKYEGGVISGYTFILNVGHRAYKFVWGRSDDGMLSRYIQEQMIRQAYLISFENNIYKGVSEKYKDDLQNGNLSFTDSSRLFEEIVGSALNQI